MDLEEKIEKLDDKIERHLTESQIKLEKHAEELDRCRTNIGEKMIGMEKESLVRLTKLETQVSTMSDALVTFVNHSQFAPVKLIAYGLAGGVLTTVLGAILAKVLGL